MNPLERYTLAMYEPANPSEGQVYHEPVSGTTRVFMDGKWNLINYADEDEVQRLRERWVELRQEEKNLKRSEVLRNRRNGINISHSVLDEHRGIDIGKSLGTHMHVGKNNPKEKSTVHILTDEELDNQTLESFNQGMETGRRRVLEELLDELSDNGQAVALVKEKLNGME